MLFEVGLFASAVLLSGVLGTIPQAANQIALNLSSMTYMIAVGLGVAATIRVGNQKGLLDFESLRRIAFSIFILMVIIDIGFALFFILFNKYLPLVYIDDISVTALASQLLIVAALFQISDGLQSVVLGALRGLQDVKKPMYITFIAYWVIGFPCCYYLGLYTEMKSAGIWLGLFIGLTASAVMLIYRFNKLSKSLILENHGIT
jgi:MATE family multidrug resistance protein